MSKVSPGSLVKAVLDAVTQTGWSGILLSPEQGNPRKFLFHGPDNAMINVWIYIWTVTHGGRKGRPDEYRIQRTTVRSPLSINLNGKTLLLGYYPDLEVFAGFDVARKREFTEGSPSTFIDIRTMRNALQDGLAFQHDEDEVVAIGVRPDQLVNYAMHASEFHEAGFDNITIPAFNLASSLKDIPEETVQLLSPERQRVVQTISRLSRDANFRQQVLHAYGHRCAVTRSQLRLIDAAHILPVGAPASVDHVTNGIALSPTYHRAYDAGLIYLTPEFDMRICKSRVDDLRTTGYIGGVDSFMAPLGRIHLPADSLQYPDAKLIQSANRFRRID